MARDLPVSPRTDTPFPYTTLVRSGLHCERADFTARRIEAALQFDLLPFTETQSDWTSAMQASGSAGLFDGDLATATREMVTHFLAFDQGNPSSIISCLEKARNDGRAVRTALTRACFARKSAV